ncbi:MAG: phosphate ABC transporter substrate-binding protein [Planctomycetota bacterium]|nr:phosphate ABC transporter substrate-binding protein [Planctomycetota bacterium]
MIKTPLKTLPLALTLSALASFAFADAVKVDSKIPEYKSVQGVSGTIKSVGSDTMNNLMTLWSEGFKKMYPAVTTEIEGKGSATAPTALIAGTANFGPMSRSMKDKEIDEFEKQFGYKPTAVPTSIDMLAVFVHKDNPIQGLTLAQVDAVFSKTRKLGAEKDAVTWGDLGLTGEWSDKPISLYGRNSASGTYGYFKEHAIGKGDFKDSVKEQPGSSSVVQSIASDKYAIGYSGIGYITADVRAVPLAKDAKSKLIEAVPENAYSGQYPMARFLYVYINMKPGTQLDPLRKEYLRYILSKQGQEDVVKDGYFPLTAKIVADSLKTIGVETAAIEAGAPR